jgi:hypothetical protein
MAGRRRWRRPPRDRRKIRTRGKDSNTIAGQPYRGASGTDRDPPFENKTRLIARDSSLRARPYGVNKAT